jgi:hypothetical protein
MVAQLTQDRQGLFQLGAAVDEIPLTKRETCQAQQRQRDAAHFARFAAVRQALIEALARAGDVAHGQVQVTQVLQDSRGTLSTTDRPADRQTLFQTRAGREWVVGASGQYSQAQERVHDALFSAKLAAQRQALFLQARRLGEVSLRLGQRAGRAEPFREFQAGLAATRQREESPQPASPLREVAANRPEPQQRCAQAQAELGFATVDRAPQSGAQISVLPLQSLERDQLAWSPQFCFGVFGQSGVVGEMAAPDIVGLAAPGQVLQGVISDGG